MKPMLIWVVLCVASVAVSSCASTVSMMDKMAGMGVVTEEQSTFDGATHVEMSPAWLWLDEDKIGGAPFKLGAFWTSNSPNQVGLVFSYESSTNQSRLYTNFSAVELNIDGKLTSYQVEGTTQHDSSGYNTVSRSIYTESSVTVPISFSAFEKMMVADDCRIRVHSTDGWADAVFSVERSAGGGIGAKVYLREFLARVASLRASTK